jgi:hypothetical protein
LLAEASGVRFAIVKSPSALLGAVLLRGTVLLWVWRPLVLHADGDARWDNRFAPPGVQGTVWAMAFDRHRIYLGGQMQSVGRLRTEAVAEGDGNHWRSLPDGPQTDPLFVNVLTLAVFQGDLYAGGLFDKVGGQPAGGLARWDGRNWSVPAGTNGEVYRLKSDGRALYASGRFTLPDRTNRVLLARWDGRTWQPLAGEGACNTSPACPDEVGLFEIVAGNIVALVNWRSGPVPYYYGLARLDEQGQWSILPGPGGTNHPSAYYDAMTTLRGQLVVGGEFVQASNAALRNVARWDGAAWHPLGEGLAGYVVDLAGDDRRLVALHELPGTDVSRRYIVSQWDGRRWAALGTNYFERGESPMRVFLGPKDEVHVVGGFSGIWPVAASGVVRWDGKRWEALFSGDYEGLAGGIPAALALAEHRGEVYLGGSFFTAGEVFSPGVARWDGKQMHDVGGGFLGEPFRVVRALASSGQELFVGGTFGSIGGLAVTNIAAWDGTKWRALGSGLLGSPRTLAWWRDALYAGGTFPLPGSQMSHNFARWDGAQWSFSTLGSNASVSALAVWRDQLYVGGGFTQAGPLQVSRLARWDGSQWHEVGGGVSSTGRASAARLAVGSDGLYVAGSFSRAGDVAATNIARWDGAHWHALGEGWPGSVTALAVHGTRVYVGGRVTNELGEVQRLGRWDGRSWSALGSDISDARGDNFGRVLALLATDDSLFVGGIFTAAGGKPAAGIARLVERPRLHLGRSRGDPPGTAQLQLEGDPGLNWRWETSADLRHWFPLEVHGNGDGREQAPDPKAPARFFRGRLEP